MLNKLKIILPSGHTAWITNFPRDKCDQVCEHFTTWAKIEDLMVFLILGSKIGTYFGNNFMTLWKIFIVLGQNIE